MSHLHLELSAIHDALIKKLEDICDLKTKKDVVENALMLLGWAASEAAKGLSIAAVDEKRKVYREVQTPALQNARFKAEGLEKAAAERRLATANPLTTAVAEVERHLEAAHANKELLQKAFLEKAAAEFQEKAPIERQLATALTDLEKAKAAAAKQDAVAAERLLATANADLKTVELTLERATAEMGMAHALASAASQKTAEAAG